MNIAKKELFVAWFFLIAAIVFEVLGTSFLKMENQILGYIFMALFIAFSYFFMGKAIKKIQVGIGLCCMGTFRDYSYTFSFFYSF